MPLMPGSPASVPASRMTSPARPRWTGPGGRGRTPDRDWSEVADHEQLRRPAVVGDGLADAGPAPPTRPNRSACGRTSAPRAPRGRLPRRASARCTFWSVFASCGGSRSTWSCRQEELREERVMGAKSTVPHFWSVRNSTRLCLSFLRVESLLHRGGRPGTVDDRPAGRGEGFLLLGAGHERARQRTPAGRRRRAGGRRGRGTGGAIRGRVMHDDGPWPSWERETRERGDGGAGRGRGRRAAREPVIAHGRRSWRRRRAPPGGRGCAGPGRRRRVGVPPGRPLPGAYQRSLSRLSSRWAQVWSSLISPGQPVRGPRPPSTWPSRWVRRQAASQ